jgi:hypothetical protein
MAGLNLPPPQTPFVDPATGILSSQGYQYFLGLLNGIAGAIPTATLAAQIAAAGTNQATALQLAYQWNVITSGAANTGVLLEALQPGQDQVVFNASGSSKNIYPPPGYQIDAQAVNAAYALANNKMQIFNFVSATQINSTQLG